MKKMLKKLFTSKKNTDLSQYNGFSDFFLRAPENTKREVIAEAARKANDDQMKVFKQAQLKVEA
ncbi:MAG: hypothetical protein WCG07_00830 [Candidatus Taylorbacteria bacterium]